MMFATRLRRAKLQQTYMVSFWSSLNSQWLLRCEHGTEHPQWDLKMYKPHTVPLTFLIVCIDISCGTYRRHVLTRCIMPRWTPNELPHPPMAIDICGLATRAPLQSINRSRHSRGLLCNISVSGSVSATGTNIAPNISFSISITFDLAVERVPLEVHKRYWRSISILNLHHWQMADATTNKNKR
jgi:hypothetical protein